MRTAGAVYKKLRELKYRHLVELYKKFLKRTPELCKYNRVYRVQTDGIVRDIGLCMLHQPETGFEPHLLAICEQTQQCASCNAFICRYTKESLKEEFERIRHKYPDIVALEWVLEQYPVIKPWYERLWNLRGKSHVNNKDESLLQNSKETQPARD